MRKRELIQQLRAVRRQARELETTLENLLEVAEAAPQNDTDDIDQHGSVFGARRHCALVRKRIAENKPGARVIGRRHLLTPEAYAEEQANTATVRLARCGQLPNGSEEDASYAAFLKRIEN